MPIHADDTIRGRVDDCCPRLSVVMPVRNGAHFLARAIGALDRSSFQDFEVIVVDDGSRDDFARTVAAFDVKVLSSGGQMGAAAARNAGVRRARAPILVFVDADVIVHEHALTQIANRFEAEPSLSAVMGAYDDDPHAQSVVSRFRNLLHAYVHQRGNVNATTFWTGLGAVRRAAFDSVGGFSPEQTLEDVEFGMRLRAAGHRIALDPSIRGKHLKKWTLVSMVTTDILKRGAPWIELALRYSGLRDDLSTSLVQRVSVAATGLLCVAIAAATVMHGLTFIAPAIALAVAMTLPAWRDVDVKPPDIRSLAGITLLAGAACALLLAAGAPFAAAVLCLAALAAMPRAVLRPLDPFGVLYSLFVTCIAMACVLVLASFPLSLATAVAALAGALELWLNREFLNFLARRMGALEALASVPLLLIYHVCCGVSVVLGFALYLTQRMKSADRLSPGTRAR